jgi:hypothetical protein
VVCGHISLIGTWQYYSNDRPDCAYNEDSTLGSVCQALKVASSEGSVISDEVSMYAPAFATQPEAFVSDPFKGSSRGRGKNKNQRNTDPAEPESSPMQINLSSVGETRGRCGGVSRPLHSAIRVLGQYLPMGWSWIVQPATTAQ